MANEVIEIEDIVDKDSLERWLTDWIESHGLDEEAARQIGVTISHRAAMRVMPLWWEWSLTKTAREHDLTALLILRSLLVSGVSVKSPTPETRRAAGAAADSATDSANAIFVIDAVTDADSAVTAADAASFAAYAAANADSTTDFAVTAAVTAADADSASVWASIRADCTAISSGVNVFATRVWFDQDNPLEDVWSSIKDHATEPEWGFWIKWYDDALAGHKPNWGMVEQIALIDRGVWESGPVAVAAEIKKIKKDNNSNKNIELFEATIFDFTFDQLEGVMRAVPMPNDWKHLDDPKLLSSFLEDAKDLREEMNLFSQALAAEGRGMQGAGAVRTYLDAVLKELQQAEDYQSLKVGKLMEYGRILEAASQNEETLKEFGPLAEPFKINTQKLRELIRGHFANTLARFAVLRDIRMEEDASHWEVLHEFRSLVADVRSGVNGKYPALAEADVAVLSDVLDSVDTLIRSLETSQSEEVQSSLKRDLDFQLAKIGATTGVYADKAAKARKQVGDSADSVIRWNKRIEGLRAFGRMIKDYLESGVGS